MKSVQIRSFFGTHFHVFGVNTEIYGVNSNSVRIQENTDQKNYVFGRFSRRGNSCYSRENLVQSNFVEKPIVH